MVRAVQSVARPVWRRVATRGERSFPSIVAPHRKIEGWCSFKRFVKTVAYASVVYWDRAGSSTQKTLSAYSASRPVNPSTPEPRRTATSSSPSFSAIFLPLAEEFEGDFPNISVFDFSKNPNSFCHRSSPC